MCLRFVFLLITQVAAWLREERWKTAEILILRHLRRILRDYETHHNQHRPHRSLSGAAPLKPLPEPVDLDLYRIRRQAQVGGLINEYRLVAVRGRGYRARTGLRRDGRRRRRSARDGDRDPVVAWLVSGS
jgi:hypothetical protein